MADMKLFQLDKDDVTEIAGRSISVEKTLQSLIERHLNKFLGVRFLASEHSTGKTHKGRIDTLGIDENGSPVIIEYKRALNENVINQGLFYLDWLLDHKGEFKLLVIDKFGKEAGETIEWSSPRLCCIASDFTKYDEHAVEQINRNIELIRYRRYGESLLLLELVNASSVEPVGNTVGGDWKDQNQQYKTFVEYLAQSPTPLRDRYENLRAFIEALGDDIQTKQLKYYIAFRRLKNFACVEVRPQTETILAYLKLDPKSVGLEPEFTRDVQSIGHYGTGDLEIRIRTDADLEKAKPLIAKSYEEN
jgi:predicted transport protein